MGASPCPIRSYLEAHGFGLDRNISEPMVPVTEMLKRPIVMAMEFSSARILRVTLSAIRLPLAPMLLDGCFQGLTRVVPFS